MEIVQRIILYYARNNDSQNSLNPPSRYSHSVLIPRSYVINGLTFPEALQFQIVILSVQFIHQLHINRLSAECNKPGINSKRYNNSWRELLDVFREN